MRLRTAALAMLAGGAADAQPLPSICPSEPSTLTIDLGAYHGAAWITDADGKPAFGGTTKFDCPAGEASHAWEGCSFSVCDLPDGDYSFRFSRQPPAAQIAFTLEGGKLRMAPTPLAVQVGNYGIDATGSRVEVRFDLRGYAGPWAVEGLGAFHGDDVGGRGRIRDGLVVLSLYPATPYAVRFGDKPGALVMAGFDGALHVSAPQGATGRPVQVQNGRLVLRSAQIAVTPGAGGAWHLAGMKQVQGSQTIRLAAGSSIVVFNDSDSTSDVLRLDDQCRPSLNALPGFNAVLAPGEKSCE